MLIIDMKMPKRCFDCPMHDYVSNRSSSLPSHVEYGWRSIEPVCNAHHELKPIPNGNERPDWCPIKGEVEYARMVHERIMDEIKDNVSLKRLEEELFVLCKEKEDADC